MELKDRIHAFAELGKIFSEVGSKQVYHEKMEQAISMAKRHNGWFTDENVRHAFMALGGMLNTADLEKWVSAYEGLHVPDRSKAKPATIGVIMAGNIPLVGFHDFLCVLMSGNNLKGKLSADDRFLLPAAAEALCSIEPGFKKKIVFVENRLSGIDAVIATGSNNTARYFEYYFSRYRHIIRKNRNSVAVLSGTESPEQLTKLGEDIFRYYGLGCRNVSKLFVPAGYDFGRFFEAIFAYKDVLQNNKYANNYEYNRTIYLMGNANIYDNNFLLLKEDIGIHSPVAVLFFEYYSTREVLESRLVMDRNNIQCIVSNLNGKDAVPFGRTQMPAVWDYADRVDTLKFLLETKRD